MDILFYVFAGATGVAAALAAIAIWAPRPTRVRVVALCVAALFIPVVYLQSIEMLEPRSYVIPWNLTLAEKLEDAVEAAVRKKSTILLKDPFFRRSLEEWGDLNVEIIPPPLPPLKRPPPPARVFNPREESI